MTQLPGTPATPPVEHPAVAGAGSARDQHGAPFLTVLLRTRGRRPATLEDALLSLAAQTCDRFEVLVLVHDPEEGAVAAVEATVATFHPRFAGRVRVVPVEGGGRAHPLNVGARMARGRYVAALDDDDVAFANWVACFEEAAGRAPGRVVRACVATQTVRSLPGAWGGDDGYEVVSRPHVDYPIEFDYLDHLVDNRTPNNGYAVPRQAVTDLGLTWDESLPVLEDWDHLMRAAAALGVESAPTVSALLRSWSEGLSSKTDHGAEVWKQTHRTIEERHTQAPVLLPAGSAAGLRARALREELTRRERDRLAGEVQRLRSDARQLSESLGDAGRRLEAVDVDVSALRAALADAEAQLDAMRSSTTWRAAQRALAALTALRRLAALAGGSRTGGRGAGGSRGGG